VLSPPFARHIHAVAWIDDQRLASTGDDATVRVWDSAAGTPESVTLLLPGDRWARFSAGGCLLDSAANADDLMYLLETPQGALDVLTQEQFAARVAGSTIGSKPMEVPPTAAPLAAAEPPSRTAEALPARKLTVVQDQAIIESSGLAASSRDDAIWTHNDDGKEARLYLLGLNGQTLGRYDLQHVKPFDWEDMCAFRRDGTNYLLIGDIGDNAAQRNDCRLHLLKEPEIGNLSPDPTTVPVVATIPFTYEDGPHDCEALAVDAERNVALLITKELDESCGLFEIPLERPGDKPVVARRVRALKLPLVTAMDISPDGRRLIALCGLHAFEWNRREQVSWHTALAEVPRRYALPELPQSEAIAYRRDGKAFFLTSEGERQPLWELELPK
jgi:hypothetical protein